MVEGKKTTKLRKKPQKLMRICFVLLILVAALVTAIYLNFFYVKPAGSNLWTTTTVPYDSTCKENCEVAGSLGNNHGSPEIDLLYNPNVDDSVAQWGDCLQSVFVCVSAGNKPNISQIEKAGLARVCVQNSTCPAPCRERYGLKAANSPEAARQAFDDVFVNEDAWCRPQERTK